LLLTSSIKSWSVGSDNSIRDSFGRTRLFHGVNVVYKSAPYIPKIQLDEDNKKHLSFTDKDAKLLQKLGLNVVRLSVFWSGVEPLEGKYDMEYLQKAKDLVNLMSKYGIYVIIEQHQDNWGEMFCGEGFPYWATKNEGFIGMQSLEFPWPAKGIFSTAYDLKEQPNIHKGIYADFRVPTSEQCEGFDPLNSYALQRNFNRLYNNEDSLQDKFIAFWELLATTFKNYSNVIGYELLNEPGPTSIFQYYVLPGIFELRELQPMYDRIGDAILAIVPDTLIFFEPCLVSDEYPIIDVGPFQIKDELTKSRFSHPPGGFKNSKQSVLAYHYYDFANFVFKGRDPKDYFESRQEEIKHLKVAGIVTEFQISSVGDDIPSTNYQFDRFDEFKNSWTGWTYKSYVPEQDESEFVPTCTGCGDGLFEQNSDRDPEHPNWKTARNLARTYAHAVAGSIDKMTFDNDGSIFELQYTYDKNITEPTVIYVNTELSEGYKARYANGLNISIEPKDVFEWNYVKDSKNLL
jgi:endoglycosylceramidase